MIDKQLLKQHCDNFKIELDDKAMDKLDTYAQTLVEWNKVMNLTTITQSDEIMVKHFLDSMLLLVISGVKIDTGATLIDVGTGAGFPAIPCKIVRPDIKITLLDSLNKRINFLNEVLKQVDVKGEAIHGRAEEYGVMPKQREKYDIATARAVAHMRELSEYCLPFVKVGGYFIALKGREVHVETDEAKNAIAQLGGELVDVVEYLLPDDSQRTMVIIKKVKPTPIGFPRNSAKMKKSPIN